MEQEFNSQKSPGEQIADLFLSLTASKQLIGSIKEKAKRKNTTIMMSLREML